MTADNRSVTSQLLKFSENVSLQGGRPREGNCRGIPVTKKKGTPQATKLQQKAIFVSNATAGRMQERETCH